MKKLRLPFLASVSVMGILLSVYYVYGMFPFGNKTLSWCDMNQQVVPLLMDFRDILLGRANLFLNLQNAGGMSFWGVFLFFLSSPFSLLAALVEKQDFYRFMNLLVLLKMMTCAFTAGFFFRNRFPGLNSAQNTALSVMYAFCGYALFYYQNLVWLDVMYLFPLFLLSLFRLLEQDKPGCFVLTFSAVMAVNFYLSYMVSVFLVLFAGIYMTVLIPRRKRGKPILLLGGSVLLVALITGVVWLPSLTQYIDSARTGDILSSLRVGGFFTRLNTTLPVVFSTAAVFAAAAFCFPYAVRSSRQTAFLSVMLILMLIPVLIEPVNKMWHTGNYQAFPVRYGYIPVFIGLILLASLLSDQNQRNPLTESRPLPMFGAMLSVGLLFLAACFLIDRNYETITVYTRTLWGNEESFSLLFVFSAIAAVTYFILLLLHHFCRLDTAFFSALLCIAVLVESLFGACVYIASPAHSADDYASAVDLSGKIKDTGLYRVKSEAKYFDVNLMGGLGYNTLSHYTSLTDQSFLYTMKKLGYSSYWMEVGSHGGTEFTDAILGNRYSIFRREETLPGEPVVYQNRDYAIRKNTVSLPIGFVFYPDQSIASLADLPDVSRMELQQEMFQALFRTEETLVGQYEPAQIRSLVYQKSGDRTEMTLTDGFPGTLEYEIPVKGKQTLYFDCFDKPTNHLVEPSFSGFSVSVNGIPVQTDYPDQADNGLLKLGDFEDETVSVQVQVLKDISVRSFGVFGMNTDRLERAVQSAAPARLHQQGNSLAGSAYAEHEGEYLFLPLTYGKGYQIRVNGKFSPEIRIFDSMIAVKLDKGENTLSIAYFPPGFGTGAALSAAGLALCAAAFFLFRGKKMEEKMRWLEFPAEAVFWVLFFTVLFAVYIFPLLVYFSR